MVNSMISWMVRVPALRLMDPGARHPRTVPETHVKLHEIDDNPLIDGIVPMQKPHGTDVFPSRWGAAQGGQFRHPEMQFAPLLPGARH